MSRPSNRRQSITMPFARPLECIWVPWLSNKKIAPAIFVAKLFQNFFLSLFCGCLESFTSVGRNSLKLITLQSCFFRRRKCNKSVVLTGCGLLPSASNNEIIDIKPPFVKNGLRHGFKHLCCASLLEGRL